MCIYKWLASVQLGLPDSCLLKRKWLCVCVCVCVCWLPLDDIITCTAHADCYHKLFPVYSPWLSFFQRGREHWGVGLSGNWLQVLKLIRSGTLRVAMHWNQAPMMVQAGRTKIRLMVKHKFNHFLTGIGSHVLQSSNEPTLLSFWAAFLTTVF